MAPAAKTGLTCGALRPRISAVLEIHVMEPFIFPKETFSNSWIEFTRTRRSVFGIRHLFCLNVSIKI